MRCRDLGIQTSNGHGLSGEGLGSVVLTGLDPVAMNDAKTCVREPAMPEMAHLAVCPSAGIPARGLEEAFSAIGDLAPEGDRRECESPDIDRT
jgi:hypothetical protein